MVGAASEPRASYLGPTLTQFGGSLLIPFPEANVRAKAMSALGLGRAPLIPIKAVYSLNVLS